MSLTHLAIAAITLSAAGLTAVAASVLSDHRRKAPRHSRLVVINGRAIDLAGLAAQGMAAVEGETEIVATLPDGTTISRQIRFETLIVAEALQEQPDQVLARLAAIAIDRLAEGAYGQSTVQP